jgi:hypothetical protein
VIKSEAGRTVQNVKGQPGRPCSSTDDGNIAVLQAFTPSPNKSVKQCSHETDVCKTSVHHILQETFLMFTSPEDGQDGDEVWSIQFHLLT